MEAFLTADAVDGIINKLRWAHSTAVADQIVASFADTLSIDVLFIGVAVTHAQSQRLDESIVTDALFSDVIEFRVNGAFLAKAV